MGWAIFWAVVFGGAVGAPGFNGWAAAFGFLLSIGWQESTRFEDHIGKLAQRNSDKDLEIEQLKKAETPKKDRQWWEY